MPAPALPPPRRPARLAAALALGAAALASCGGGQEGGAVFRYNESKGIPTLDPAFARNQTIIWPVSNIFDGLVRFDSALRVTPAVARGWELDSARTTYTFHLRPDVEFHPHPAFGRGGTRRVTAADFAYSFARVASPATGSPGAWVFDAVDTTAAGRGFEAVDDTTLRVRLRAPFVPFLGMLAMTYCSVVPREVVEALGDGFGQAPVGTGPFAFRLWDINERLILLRNPRYFGRDAQGGRLPRLDAVHVTFIADKQSEFMEFLLGNLDFISGVHATNRDELLTPDGRLRRKHQEAMYMQRAPYLNSEYLGFNLDSTRPGFVPYAVRRALNHAVDRGRMARFLRNNLAAPATGSLIPPSLMPPGTPAPDRFRHDPALAARLLRDAGYGPGRPVPEITLTTTPDYLDIGEYVQHAAAEAGIPVRIQTSTGAAFRQSVANGELDFFRASWIADYPHAENYLLLFTSANQSPAGPNYTHLSDSTFDRLYALVCTDSAAAGLIAAADSLAMAKAPVVPLFYDMVVRFVRSEIGSLPLNPLNMIDLREVTKAPKQPAR